MKLIKTKTKNGKQTCLINTIQNGGDYTACGIACDSCLGFEGAEWIKDKPAKKPTCPECIETIKWYKSIEI